MCDKAWITPSVPKPERRLAAHHGGLLRPTSVTTPEPTRSSARAHGAGRAGGLVKDRTAALGRQKRAPPAEASDQESAGLDRQADQGLGREYREAGRDRRGAVPTSPGAGVDPRHRPGDRCGPVVSGRSPPRPGHASLQAVGEETAPADQGGACGQGAGALARDGGDCDKAPTISTTGATGRATTSTWRSGCPSAPGAPSPARRWSVGPDQHRLALDRGLRQFRVVSAAGD